MTTNCSELCVAVVSDIHLGHRRNSTVEIIKNLVAAFPDNAETGEIDILFLAGDVFDDQLALPDEDVMEIDVWISRLLRICKKRNILVRVLEGTPSHDWKQSQRFESINELADIGANLQYVKTLSIEFIPDYGINVLYVPDEWESTTEKTLSQVHELLRAKGLDSVDYAIMHGQFKYQLPAVVKAPTHDAEAYLKIVRELIFIGHVHIHSRYERIIAQGSFDRLSHGEEGPKGHVRAVIKANGDRNVTFVENVGAKVFKTVRCLGMNLDETIAEVDRSAGMLPKGSFVRIESDFDNPIFTNMEMLIRRHPFFTWSKLIREADSEDAETVIEDETIFVPITLTRENLGDLLVERITVTEPSLEVLNAAKDILKEVM